MTHLLKEDSGLTDFLRQMVGPDPTENKGKKYKWSRNSSQTSPGVYNGVCLGKKPVEQV